MVDFLPLNYTGLTPPAVQRDLVPEHVGVCERRQLLGVGRVRDARQALAIAASLSSGLVANFGTMTKPFHAGHAARNGLLAATGAGIPTLITMSTYTAEEDFSEAVKVVPELGDAPNVLITIDDLNALNELQQRFTSNTGSVGALNPLHDERDRLLASIADKVGVTVELDQIGRARVTLGTGGGGPELDSGGKATREAADHRLACGGQPRRHRAEVVAEVDHASPRDRHLVSVEYVGQDLAAVG